MDNKYIHGFTAADRVLRQLPSTVETRVLQRVTRIAANLWRSALRAAAPRNSGKQSKASKHYGPIVKNIKSAVLRKAKRKGQRGTRVSTGGSFWSYFYEFGSVHQSARPWFRPTVEQNADAVTKKLKTALGSVLESETKKLAQKNGVKK